MRQIFLSYARIDRAHAERLYRDLSRNGNAHVWFDRVDLLPGVKWRPAIRKAIRDSQFFVALLSATATSKRGYRHTELREAVDMLKEFPDDAIFLIPTRVDECEMPIDDLEELNYADLFPTWKTGLQQLRAALRLSAPSRARKAHIRRASPNRNGEPRTRRPPSLTRVGPAPVRYAIKLLDIDGGLNAATKIANGLNGVQQTFTFTRARGVAPELARRMVNGFPHLDIDRVPDTFYTRVSPLDDDRVVCLTDRFLTFTERKKTRSNYLAYNPPAHERVFFVSYHGLRDHAAEAGVSFEAAVAFMVIGELVDYFFEIGYHKQTRNCPMDFTEQHADLVGGLQAGRFCAPCEKKLKKNPTLERAVKAMLAWDR